MRNHSHEITNYTRLAAFQFLYMTLAINITDECGLSNEACCELPLKKSKVILYLSFTLQ